MSESIQVGLQMAGALAVALGILVVIHEFGHFIVAKLFGVRVETFSIGFGPRLAGFRYGDTDYRISAVPLGGYVKMTGENPDEEITGDPRELGSRPRWQRFLVFVMGALLNIVLAIALMTFYFYRTGGPPPAPTQPPVVQEVVEGSSAEAEGIKAGDILLEVAGRDVKDTAVLVDEVVLSPGTTKTMLFERDGERFEAEIAIGSDPKYTAGVLGMTIQYPTDEPPATSETNPIRRVRPDTPAEGAGIEAGDRIVAVNDKKLPTRGELVAFIGGAADKEITLGILRNGSELEIRIVPEETEVGGRIGVEFEPQAIGVVAAFSESLRYNKRNAGLLFVTLKKLIRGDVGLRVMSGPIEIAGAARQAFGLGFDTAVNFLAFVSLQLGIINLLPIPMLDGGHIFILLIEGILRRELSAVLKERVMLAGLAFLIIFAGVIIYFDFVKLAMP